MQLKILGGLVVLASGAWAVQKIDHSLNYVPAMARITGIDSECKLKKVESGVLTKTTTTSRTTFTCAEAQELAASEPVFAGMTPDGDMTFDVDYVSPVDKAVHHGKVRFNYRSHVPLARLQSGETLPILASKSDPAKITHD
jgi:hypothetical protein